MLPFLVRNISHIVRARIYLCSYVKLSICSFSPFFESVIWCFYFICIMFKLIDLFLVRLGFASCQISSLIMTDKSFLYDNRYQSQLIKRTSYKILFKANLYNIEKPFVTSCNILSIILEVKVDRYSIQVRFIGNINMFYNYQYLWWTCN